MSHQIDISEATIRNCLETAYKNYVRVCFNDSETVTAAVVAYVSESVRRHSDHFDYMSPYPVEVRRQLEKILEDAVLIYVSAFDIACDGVLVMASDIDAVVYEFFMHIL